MMTVCAGLALTLLAQAPEGGMSADQFERLVRAEHAKIKDFALIYEGRNEFVGSPDLIKGKDPKAFGSEYQGLYYYRSDGAELIDAYSIGLEETSLTVRTKKSVFPSGPKGQMTFTETKMVSDLDMEETSSSPGSSSMLSGYQSPQSWIFISDFHSIPNFREWGFEFQGWEMVGDRRCARIKLKWAPGDTKWHHLMWIDVARGCHPLKIEDHRDGPMFQRLDQVELKRFELPDHTDIWMPVKGRIEAFEWAMKPSEQPTTRETISVVDGSVLLNQGLTDSVFKVGPTPKTPVTTRLERRAGDLPLRKAFLSLKREPPRRTDPAGVQKRLDTMLEAADEQSEQLQASSPAREPWSRTTMLQYAVVGLGSVAVFIAGVILFRSRGRR
jgi:hypothetical protein